MDTKMIKNIEKNCNCLGDKTGLFDIPLDSGDSRLLDVREGLFDDHVALQPAAIAYYGYMKKTANRNLDIIKRQYESWKKKTYHVVKGKIEKVTKKRAVAGDIDANMSVNYEQEIDEWNDKLDEAQSFSDTMDIWYDAWKQKSHSIREYSSVITDEKMTTSHIIAEGKVNAGIADDSKVKNVNEDAFNNRAKGETTLQTLRRIQKGEQ